MTAPFEFMIPEHLIAPEGETIDALNYSVGSTWTRLYNLPGHTGFTAHFIQLGDIVKRLPIANAAFRLVYQSSDNTQPSARVIALSYGSGGGVWEYDWCVFTRDGNNPTNQKLDVTTKLLSLLSCGRSSPQVGIEVYGAGVIHQATLEITYSVADYAAAFADLSSRVDAIEAAALVATEQVIEVPAGGLSLRFVQQVVS